jgi:hypothetical protein
MKEQILFGMAPNAEPKEETGTQKRNWHSKSFSRRIIHLRSENAHFFLALPVFQLTDHGRCCFVWLLEYQPVTEGVCDDVLDVVEGIAGETVVELTQEENNMRVRYDSDKKMYT